MSDQAPKKVPFRVLGETDDLLAVEKPPFMLIHPTRPGGGVTLWDHLRELLAYEIAGGGQVSLINRLDRETSGIVLVAKNSRSARSFHRAMKRGEIEKEYLAIVAGWPERDRWSVDEPILRLGEVGPSRIWLKRGIHPEGAAARTLFSAEQRFSHPLHGKLALIRCHPLTGRTHQIRVHLSHSGYPVVGDKLYGPSEQCYLDLIEGGWSAELEKMLLLPRHALHSSGLSVTLDGRHYAWSSGLPADLESFLAGASPLPGCKNHEEAEA